MKEGEKRHLTPVKEVNQPEDVEGETDDEPPTEEELLLEELREHEYFNKKRGKISGQEAIGRASVFALYFSASWSPPCREFAPILADLHREVTKQGTSVQIICVPFDKTEDSLWEYVDAEHGDGWLILPLEDPLIQKLKERYDVGSVPKLVVISGITGQVITKKGRKEVQDKGVIAFRIWTTVAARALTLVNK